MPKAYSDEDFENEVVQNLVKRTWIERLKYLLSAKHLALTFSIIAGFTSLITAFLTVIDHQPTSNEVSDPLAVIGRRLSEQADKIGTANDEIRRVAQALTSGEARIRILEQQRVIEEEAAVLKVYGEGLAKRETKRDKRSIWSIFSPAYAQSGVPSPPRLSVDDVRLYGIVLILSTLGVAFILCIGIILFSDHAKRLTFAIDTVKVLMGFFVGVATSFFGAR
ncbi:MAG TPA: hypothetical protein VN838_04170 [Bradyrhizobium sp.]|nr:hypothetical protein [Bradyrhizobium sp.]